MDSLTPREIVRLRLAISSHPHDMLDIDTPAGRPVGTGKRVLLEWLYWLEAGKQFDGEDWYEFVMGVNWRKLYEELVPT